MPMNELRGTDIVQIMEPQSRRWPRMTRGQLTLYAIAAALAVALFIAECIQGVF